ncbi:class I adenylate-forming enzyme family protein [Salinisphaera aquimarina]|uniref:Class I adenylate-forming enzyme family protein n=1 Tax=Salinisphaera aquimarina TaxID=2094031 RepID=A0ABV7ENW2_9GAMM
MTPDQPETHIAGRPVDEIIATLPARIHTAVAEWNQHTPDAEAIVDDDIRWRYEDLARAQTVARDWLHGLGVGPGDRVMIVGENGRALPALLLACSALDAWAVIINARLSAPEIDNIRNDCQPARVIYTPDCSAEAGALADRAYAERIDLAPLGELAVSTALPCTPEPVIEDGGQVAAMIYTSGTTGSPKGVMLTHRGLLFVAAIGGGLRRVGPGDRLYGVLPTSHVFGLSSVCLGALSRGACLHPVARFDPNRLVDALARERISILQGVPAMFAATLETLRRSGEALDAPALRYISVGGAPMDMDLKARVEASFGLTLHNGYGLTEASPTISQTRLDDHHDNTTVGPILPGVRHQIRTDDGRVLGPGETGELWAAGPNIMAGYFRRPEATATALQDGWLNTGDLAHIDARGLLFIVGRTKELIIRSGFNVYPADVEAVLNAHPDVVQSAVVGRTVANNEEVVAFVQRVAGSALTADALIEFSAGQLSGYKRPGEIVFLDTLPATATGKILKSQLKTQATEKATEQAPSQATDPAAAHGDRS